MEHSGRERLAKEAEVLIKRARHTGFAHKPTIDRTKASYEVDDGTFVALLLESLPPGDFAQIHKQDQEQYPSAEDFYEFFATGRRHGWERVSKLSKVTRGDIVAWKGSRGKQGRASGHVAVVSGPAEFDQEAKEWAVPVHDSSSDAHFDDTRQGESGFHPGLGSGILRFRIDARGKPVAVKLGDHSNFHKRPIVIGRLADRQRRSEPTPKSPSADVTTPFGHRIDRAAVANEVLGAGEFAVTTYTRASTGDMLLLPTTLACWGPGQKVPQSLGSGATSYGLAGGVVFRNSEGGP
jgi:hypothetical protein